jgi:uncharacterized protein
MLCPIDQTDLRVADRRGVEIDYCPRCRGVWLDRGELDKILERETADLVTNRVQRDDVALLGRERRSDYRDQDGDDEHEWDERRGRRRRRGGWLGDLFEFGD